MWRAEPTPCGRRKWICASGQEVHRDVDVKWRARLSVPINFGIDRMLEQGQTAIDHGFVLQEVNLPFATSRSWPP
jgi:hypothetical protein